MILLKLLFGLAIFLYAMRGLERGIRKLSGEGLNRWIVARTNSPISSAGCGVLVTAILQSSSMVSLVVLAFVSAGIMPLYNGIGVVLGANLGTTFTGWLVTVIGFKMHLQSLVIPLLGLGAALTLVFKKNARTTGLGNALFAFGLLIFGLDIMKESVAGLSQVFDITALQDVPPWVYLLCGTVLAAVMQSSSAVMLIALSMINSDMVQLTDAAAVVIGADLGTTSTTVLGSIGKSVVKKQLAFAHVCFNVLVNTMAFFLLLPALPELLEILSIEDPMFGLVAFHSTFNFAGMVIFLPLLKVYTRGIQRLLPLRELGRAGYFDVPVEVFEAAMDSLGKAHRQLSADAVKLSWQGLELDEAEFDRSGLLAELEAADAADESFEHNYEALKHFEGDLIRYAGKLRPAGVTVNAEQRINRLVKSARSLVYATKTLKDVRLDFVQLRLAVGNKMAVELYASHCDFLENYYRGLLPLLFTAHDQEYHAEQINYLSGLNDQHHQFANDLIARHLAEDGIIVGRLSTWFNLNHELHHYARYMLSAVVADA